MPRRKQTREEIEEVLRDNLRVNATPTAPDDPAGKKRRQSRGRARKRNLNKALEAIQIGGGDENKHTCATITASTIASRVEQAYAIAPVPIDTTPAIDLMARRRRQRNVEQQRRRRAANRCRRRIGIGWETPNGLE
ncbi:hypothetical protein PHYPSEUDO_009832 [Phytophthora pseudosyringae]|uniref:Uncharacterized protein n=1 Tax=Phytophthora pseudosyringae TaxID=221518 RepID=A0A8T1VBH6_9STRA|nr:hypothetical protein PHYPSEUDO_009832 [Phytophthora pseudosyringae]